MDMNHNIKDFKNNRSFESRKKEAMAIRSKYPTKVPLIVEKYRREKKLASLEKTLYLAQEDMTMPELLVILRHRMKMKHYEVLYLLIGNKSMLNMSLTMAQVYEQFGDEDGFLYISYASQDVFSYQNGNRKEEAMAIRYKYPTKVPLIVEKYRKEKKLPSLEKTKFLVPEDVTMSQLLVILRHRIKIRHTEALYLLIRNKSMVTMSMTMAQAYEQFADEDGFLYITYASQEVFGYQDDISGSTQEVEAIRHRFPNKVPLYVTRYGRDCDVPALGRNKFLVPQEITMSQFLFILRNKIKLKDSQALYLLVNDRVLVSQSLTMAQAYEQFRSHDGFLHITYAGQQAFGTANNSKRKTDDMGRQK